MTTSLETPINIDILVTSSLGMVMIPYFEIHSISVGPVDIQVWGVMVVAGLLAGARASEWILKRRGLDSTVVWNAFPWIVLSAFVFARAFHVLFYDLGFYLTHPSELIAFWHGGLSIIGGFIGAVLAVAIYSRRKHLDFARYADALVFGLPLGLFLGRVGCFLIHDHPGKLTNFFLGVKYPDGLIHHDHGLYLSLNGLAMFVAFLFMSRRKVREGSYLVVFLVWYGAVRFLLDFLRAYDGAIVDARYLGLTPAQYFSLAMIVFGGCLLLLFRHRA